jgi:hypothetical protein
MTKQLQVGATYFGRFISNHDSVIIGTITKRTAKFVWVVMENGDGEVKKCGVKVYGNSEYCLPLGAYSMAPSLNADRPIEALKR